MTAIATRLLVVLLVYGAAPSVSAPAQTRPDQNPQEQVSQTAREPAAIDIARIRRLLGERLPPGPEAGLSSLPSMLTVESRPQPIAVDANGVLRFSETVYVVAPKWRNPTFAKQYKAFEKQSRIPYNLAPSLQELSARMPGLQYFHPVNAVMAANKAIRGALYRAKVEKARREVEAELRALKAHNAALAAADSKPPKEQH